MDEERKPRFTGWMKKENQGLQVVWKERSKVYRLDEERRPRFAGLMKKENQGLQIG